MYKTKVKNEGFEGILFPGNGQKEKILIVMSGSNGGMNLTKQCAKFYNDNGIPALALALFGTKGTQPFLDRVPIEYVENAINWLKKQGYKKIGIDGMSKGSEIALISASMFPENISRVIVRVPSYFVSEGLIKRRKSKGPSGTSCWSYKGREIPYAPYKTRNFNILKMFKEEKELHLIDFNKDKEIIPESIINISKIKAPILMLSSKKDSVWPSYDSAVYMNNKLKETNFSYPYKHIAYENISHALLTKIPYLYKIFFKTERENPIECKEDRDNLKKDLLEWVNNVW